MPQHILIVGDPVEGFKYIGPFPGREAARAQIEFEFPYNPNVWVVELTPAKPLKLQPPRKGR